MKLEELESPKVAVEMVGKIWQPGIGLCAQEYTPKVADGSTDHPARTLHSPIAGEWSRETVAAWLASNAGDFSEVVDFRATVEYTARRCECCGQVVRASEEIPWQEEENELAFADSMFGQFEE